MKNHLLVTAGLFIALTLFRGPSAGPALAEANQLFLSQSCAGGKANVTFSWLGNDPSALQQWLDLSSSETGWLTGSFSSAGPLAAATTSYLWEGLEANALYYARVNQQLSDGSWDSSAIYQVQTMGCVSPPVASSPPPDISDSVACSMGDNAACVRVLQPLLPPNVTVNVIDCATASPPLRTLLGC